MKLIQSDPKSRKRLAIAIAIALGSVLIIGFGLIFIGLETKRRLVNERREQQKIMREIESKQFYEKWGIR